MKQLKSQMLSAMAAVLRKKNLLVWKKILLDLPYSNPEIVDEVCAGCVLTG